MDPFALRGNALWCEGVPLQRIAAEVGTPVYVYSTAAIVRQARGMREAVAGSGSGDPLVAFAVKANPNIAVLRVVAAAGLGADVVSIGEYRRALAAGIAPQHIVFSGVGKTAAEVSEALAGGVLQFNAESVEELRMLSGVARRKRAGRAGGAAHQSRRRRRYSCQDHHRHPKQQVRDRRRRHARGMARGAGLSAHRAGRAGSPYRQPDFQPDPAARRVRAPRRIDGRAARRWRRCPHRRSRRRSRRDLRPRATTPPAARNSAIWCGR